MSNIQNNTGEVPSPTKEHKISPRSSDRSNEKDMVRGHAKNSYEGLDKGNTEENVYITSGIISKGADGFSKNEAGLRDVK
jgi:hypothetical protein